jgi:glycosyltransferase involved in cell wall biosynthesis
VTTESISVALCTYNGGAFLREQLESIGSQTFAPAELVICDDQSSDNTQAIVSAFATEASFPVRYFVNDERLGVIRNFETAIRRCSEPYIALSDQDDVWLPDKLSLEMSLLRKTEQEVDPGMPVLVHSDLSIVDERLAPLHASLRRYQKLSHSGNKPLSTLLVQNYVTGCTILMNRALVDVALPLSRKALMHDWWLALCAGLYGEIRTLPASTVLYRQHGGNEVGALSFWRIVTGKIAGYLMRYRAEHRRSASDFHGKIQQAVALRAHVHGIQRYPVRREMAEDLDRFLGIFDPDVGMVHRLIRAMTCDVRPNTKLQACHYLMRVASWSEDALR